MAFADALLRYLLEGARPGVPKGPRWTYASFARALADIVEDGEACSPNAVSNWCKGKFVPRAIEPILDVLFDPNGQGPERINLRRAYNLAVEETLREAKLQPALVSWIPDGPRLALDHKPRPADAKVARDPAQQQLQQQVAGQARALAKSSDRPSNALNMKRLSDIAFAFADLMGCEPAAMPDHLGAAYGRLGQLAGILETDDEVRADNSDAPLDAGTRGQLRDLLALASLCLRGYPKIIALDDREATTWPPPEVVDAARTLLRRFREADCLTLDDHAEATTLLDAAAVSPRGGAKPGSRARKAANLAVGAVINLLVTAARQVAAARVGIAAPDPAAADRAARLAQALLTAQGPRCVRSAA